MQRARRLASVAVTAALAVSGLTACRSQPDVAAYLADGNISLKRVQDVYNDARDKQAAADAAGQNSAPAPSPAGTAAPAKLPLTGDNVLETLVSHQVLMTLAQRHNVRIPSPLPLKEYAQLLHLPPDAEYVKLYVEVEGLQFALNQGGQGGPLTDADVRDVFERAKAQNLVDPASTPQQFAAGLSAGGKKVLGTAIAVRNEVRTEIGRQGLRLNPRYHPFDIPVLTERDQQTGAAQILVAQPVGDNNASAPVTDVG
jgi:hypothetical protein